MAEIRDYDVTAANNNSSPPDGAPEGQLPSTINDTIREVMARLKREWSDRSGVNTTAGTSNAYTLAASQTITAYAAGDVFMFIADRANTGAATLAVDGLAAKSLVSNAQTALVANQIVANGIYVAAYDATNDTFQVMGVTDTGGALTLTSLSTDTINEKTSAAGVTVDGVLLKDGGAVFADGASIEIDTVNEATAAAGVTVDGVILKDSQVSTDTINEKTAAAGVTVDGVLLKDGGAVLADGATLEVDTINEATAAAGVTADGVLLQDGKVLLPNGGQIKNTAATGSLEMSAGTATAPAGSFEAYGESHASFPGNVYIGGSGDITLRHYNGSGFDRNLILSASATTFNAEAVDQDFTVKSQSFGYAFVIDGQTGDVGIGVTPTAKLHVTNTGSGDSFLVEDSTNPDSTPFVINASGSVGIGTTTASISGYAGQAVLFEGSSNFSPQSSWRNTASDATAGYFHFEKSRSGGLVSASDVVGTLYWRAHDGTDYRPIAAISAQVGDTPAAGDTPGILRFSTTAEGSTTATERMRIDSSGNVGIGVTAPDRTLHVHTASAGTVTAHPDADDLVVENSGSSGISVLTPDVNFGYLGFGSPSDNLGAYLRWKYDDSELKLSTSKVGGELVFASNNGAEAVRIDSSGYVGIGISDPEGTMHVHSGSAGVVTANTGADDFVVENSSECGISLLAPDAQNTNIYFGSPTDNAGAFLRWNHDAGLFKVSTDLAGAEMAFSTAGGTERMRIDSAGNVGIGVSSPVRLLHLQQTDNPIIRLNETATSTSYIELSHLSSNTSRLQHTAATGGPALDLDAYASDGASTQFIRAFRNSHPSAAAVFALYQPGTVDIQHHLSSGDTYVVAQTGDFGVGTSSPTEKLDVNGDAIRVRSSQTPASASAAGDAGQICWDANYIYVCTATNTWKRSALATW